jgi:hypothetical protein
VITSGCLVLPAGTANADVYASVGRRISVSGCTNVADTVNAYVPLPGDYAPLPGDFPPPPPSAATSQCLCRCRPAGSTSAGAIKPQPHFFTRPGAYLTRTLV